MEQMENGIQLKPVEAWMKYCETGCIQKKPKCAIITISSEPGSGGSIVAQKIAEEIGFDVYHRDMVKKIAESIKITPTAIDTLEKERFSGIQDFVDSLINDNYIWSGLYIEHLENALRVITKKGKAVIVGRGANFMISRKDRLAVRVVAPLESRIKNVMNLYAVSEDVAAKRINKREDRRKAFIKETFNENLRNPANYDITVNTDDLGIEGAVFSIKTLLDYYTS